MKSKSLATKSQDLMSMIHAICPDGVGYTNDVINLCADLSDASMHFYNGVVFFDYGIFPFLNVEEIHLKIGKLDSKHVIIRSEFDKESFVEFVNALSIKSKIKKGVIEDVNQSYGKSEHLLDKGYLLVMRHLIECLKALQRRREEKMKNEQVYIDILLSMPLGLSHVVTAGEVDQRGLRKTAREYNRKSGKASGRFIKVRCYPDVPSAVIVTCEQFVTTPYKKRLYE